jgi:hypothetical protein
VPSLPSPVLRVLQGLAENSGRTIIIAGPAVSGKSALLEEIREQVVAKGARVIALRGSYRGRSVPYGALDGLRDEPSAEAPSESADEDGAVPDAPIMPIAPVGFLPERMPRSRRGRGDGRRTSFLGQPIRARAANEGNPEAYWREILPEISGPTGHPVAILIEDGSLFDSESRDFVVALSRHARLRPLLIGIVLDTSVPGYVAWEDAFLGRGDVDWVRIQRPLPDPREAHRLKRLFDDTPSVTQKVVGYVDLLGGSVGEVVLSRITRLNFSQLAEAILPATEVGLLKVQDGKVTLPHLAWNGLVADLLPEKQRAEMHLEIANALTALSPEPGLARRIEVARHFLAWYPGPMALRHLLEAAELSLHLLAYDSAEELLAQAIGCLGAVPPAERTSLEPELKLLHARALFPSGRLAEAESELQSGVDASLKAGIPTEELAEWIEPLILDMRVVGPRPSLVQTLVELVERGHDSRSIELEVLLEALIAEFHWERGRTDEARAESHRAALLARKLPEGHLQAIALLAVGLSRIEGSGDEQELASRFLKAARALLGRSRRWELDHLAEDLEARLLEVRGETARARILRERSLTTLQRQKLPPIELYHQLGIAEILLDAGGKDGLEGALARAHTLVDSLHLLPPSPALLRTWLLEGRQLARSDLVEEARDRFAAVAEEPGALGIPRLRAEALLRLALLEYADGREEEGAAAVASLRLPEVLASLPRRLAPIVDRAQELAPTSEHGGGPLPPPEPAAGPASPQERERRRRDPVRDRQRPHYR